MRDFRATEEVKVRSLPNKSKITGAILNNLSAEEIKSASSFNRSFNKSDGIQESPEISKEVLNRVTSNFGIPIGGEAEYGNASPLFINKGSSRTATILN